MTYQLTATDLHRASRGVEALIKASRNWDNPATDEYREQLRDLSDRLLMMALEEERREQHGQR